MCLFISSCPRNRGRLVVCKEKVVLFLTNNRPYACVLVEYCVVYRYMRSIWLNEKKYSNLKLALENTATIATVANSPEWRRHRGWVLRNAKLVSISKDYDEFRMFLCCYNQGNTNGKRQSSAKCYRNILRKAKFSRRLELKKEFARRGLAIR